ncbi:SRPBCC family protein [Inquilinus sp. OTU3971]|uniref:SRPBCC family protein n=1 Tax=Inquilinus sp. OTU3971 TaxID=3043855 RepID=UPI00313C7ECD
MSRALPSRTLSVWIDRDPDVVYAFLSVPENFMQWASGLADSLRREGDGWVADTPEGTMRVRFTPPNPFRIADHWVIPPNGAEISLPIRVLANGGGSEVTFHLFRLPEMDDARFARDAEWVERDLATLKRVLETSQPGA